jgi:hypothetical protein
VVVVATRSVEDRSRLSASTTGVSGADHRNRGANDLRSALALVAESELADASYYRLEGRRVWRSFTSKE